MRYTIPQVGWIVGLHEAAHKHADQSADAIRGKYLFLQLPFQFFGRRCDFEYKFLHVTDQRTNHSFDSEMGNQI